MKIILKLVAAAVLSAIACASFGQANWYNKFGPANGILKGSTNTYFTQSATAADVIGLWTGTCDASHFLNGAGGCALGGGISGVTLSMPSGFSVGGTPCTTGSCAFNVTTALNGVLKGTGTAFTTAASADILGLFSGTCSIANFLRGDGACSSSLRGGFQVTDSTGTTNWFQVTSNGSVVAGSATGGAMGLGSGNFSALYINGSPVGISSGSVSSVGLGSPDTTLFTVSGSPVTAAGTLAYAYATGQPTHKVLGTGTTGTWGPLALAASDLPGSITSSTSGNAATATALAATPTQCAGGNFSTGIAASGNANCTALAYPVGANPSASLGLTAVNGTATTFMRSDGAPALSQSIAPTWTGDHVFSPASGVGLTVNAASAARGAVLNGAANQYTIDITASSTSGQSLGERISAGTGSGDTAWFVQNQAGTTTFAQMFGDGGLVLNGATGGDKGVGSLNMKSCFVNGVACSTSSSSGTVTSITSGLGLVASPTPITTTGSLSLDQTFSPTWTGVHTFSGAPSTVVFNSTSGGIPLNQQNTIFRDGTVGNFSISSATDAAPTTPVTNIYIAQRSGTAWTNTIIGNTTDNPTLTVTGTGASSFGGAVSVTGALTVGGQNVCEVNGTNCPGGITGFANPSATMGLTAINGTAVTAMRSDASPALSQAISPTWTGNHAFSASSGVAVTVNAAASGTGAIFNGSANSNPIAVNSVTTAGQSFGPVINAGTNSSDYALFIRNGAASSTIAKFFGDGGLTIGAPTGGDQGPGTVNSTGEFVNGVAVSTAVPANPTAVIGLTTVNGSASTFMRSDAAQALSQSISPTMIGNWIYNPSSGISQTINSANNSFGEKIVGGSTTGQSLGLLIQAGTNSSDGGLTVRNQAGTGQYFAVYGDGGAVVGNPTGSDQGFGSFNAQSILVNGVAVSTASAASPSGSVGLTSVNGSSTSFMRADAAPPLSQSISPTMTGNWTLTPSSGIAQTVNAKNNNVGVKIVGGATTGQSFGLDIQAGTNSADGALDITNEAGNTLYLAVFGDGGTTFGNPTGGDKGAGSINAQSIFLNGTALSAGSSPQTFSATWTVSSGCTTTPSVAMTWVVTGTIAVMTIPDVSCTITTGPAPSSITISGTYPNSAVIPAHAHWFMELSVGAPFTFYYSEVDNGGTVIMHSPAGSLSGTYHSCVGTSTFCDVAYQTN